MIGDPIGGEVEESAGTMFQPFVFLPPSGVSTGGGDIPALRALIEAGNKSILLGPYAYYWGEHLPAYDGLVLRGQSERSTNWYKTFNGDLHAMGYGAHYEGFTVRGNYQTYSGRGFITGSAAHHMTMQRVTLAYMQGHALACTQETPTDGNGHGLKAKDCTFNSFGPPSGPGWEWAVKLPDQDTVAGGNRKFINMECGGMPGFNLAGANNTRIDGSSFGGMIMTAACRTTRISDCRFFDNNAGETLFRGTSHQLIGNQIGHPIRIKDDCFASFFLMGTLGGNHSGVVREDPAINGNLVM